MIKYCFLYIKIILLALVLIGCDGYYPLHDAVLTENIDKIKKILNNGYDIDKTDDKGRTALYLASLQGSTKIVKLLISWGADLQKGASWKGYKSPIHNASERGYIKILKLLLDNKTTIDLKDSSNNTALLYAIRNAQIEIALLLINKGADVNVVNRHKLTPLTEACRICSEEIIKALIEKGAKSNVNTVQGETPKSLIKECKNESLYQLLP